MWRVCLFFCVLEIAEILLGILETYYRTAFKKMAGRRKENKSLKIVAVDEI